MKYIKSFKLFEYNELEYEIKEHAEEIFGDDYIDDYFDKNYSVDVKEWISMGYDFWWAVDDDEFIEQFIDDEVEHYYQDWEYRFGDYEKDEMISYISDNIEEDIKEEILNLYITEYLNLDPEDPDDKEEIENDTDINDWDDYLSYLSAENCRDIISEHLDRSEFIEEYLKERYRNSSAKEILEEFGYTDEDMYDAVSRYIDDDKIEKDIKDSEEWDYKLEFFTNNVLYNKDELHKVYEKMPKLSYLIFEESDIENFYFSKEYKFQKNCLDYWMDTLTDSKVVKKLIELSDKVGINDRLLNKLKTKSKYEDIYIELNADRFGL